jgi:hypothetical protein
VEVLATGADAQGCPAHLPAMEAQPVLSRLRMP